jgi:hypothetical protein
MCIGEYGYWITVASMGSAISVLIGKVAAFQYGSEIFLATVNSSTQITPIYRGIGGTVQSALTNGGTITLLKVAWIFLGNDMLTVNSVYDYPSWSSSAPAAPATYDHWWDTAALTWKTWNGAAWVVSNEVYLGMAICNTTACAAVDPDDFNIVWDSLLNFERIDNSGIWGEFAVSVAGNYVRMAGKQSLPSASGMPSPGTGWAYFYADKFGNITMNGQPPRISGKRLGLYLPGSYKRLIGCCRCHAAPYIYDNFTFSPEGILSLNFLQGYSVTEAFTGLVAFNPECVCPIAFEEKIVVKTTVGTGLSGSVQLKDINNSYLLDDMFAFLGLVHNDIIITAYDTSLVKCGIAAVLITNDGGGTTILFSSRQKIKIS